MVEEGGEWTRVKAKSRPRRTPRNTQKTTKAPPAAPLDVPCSAAKPVAEIEAEYETFKSRWVDSGSEDRIKELVASNAAACQPIRKAVCLGIGTFDPDHGGWDAKRRTYVQLIVFLSFVEQLSAVSTEPIPCLFQEPIFTSSDKAFVQSLGHTVVESPAAFEAADEHTLLFAVHMYRPIYEAALEKALPVMFVGTGWETWDNFGNLNDGDFKLMRDIHDSHRLFEFPQDGTHTTFSSTVLYWRPRSAAELKDSSTQAPLPATEESITTSDETQDEHHERDDKSNTVPQDRGSSVTPAEAEDLEPTHSDKPSAHG